MKEFLIKKLLKNSMKNGTKTSNTNSVGINYKLMIPMISIVFFFFFILINIIIMYMPLILTQQYVSDMKSSASLFFEKVGNVLTFNGWCSDSDGTCQKKAEQKYYQELDEVYYNYKEKNIEIDTDLITATVFYGSTLNNDATIIDEEGDQSISYNGNTIVLSDIKNLAENMIENKEIDYTKYRNYLTNTYVEKRFSNMYSSNLGKEKIVDEIMGYANKKKNIAQTNNTNLQNTYSQNNCSYITLNNKGAIEIHELEEYVAGVVEGENGGAGIEAKKLQAVAARTYALKNCNRVINNNANEQFYKSPTQGSINAAEATKGEFLTYNGNIFEISFASYPKANYQDPNGFPGYYAQGYLCSDVVCQSGSDGRSWCTTTLYKQPNMEKYELYMPETNLSGNKWNGISLQKQTGHCYGISQVASIYYEQEKKYTYKQMIEEFLSPNVEIRTLQSTILNGNASTQGTHFLPKPLNIFLQENGSSIEEMNNTIKQAVEQAGPGTRNGVTAATTTLINYLAQYKVKLPYISSVNNNLGKYMGYGVDPEWGTNGKWHSNYYKRDYYQIGLDCSGLVSWAIHNGGFKYNNINSTGFRDLGIKKKFSSYEGKPADLLWEQGHIAIIISVLENEYVMAEEAGGENGMRVRNISKTTGGGFTYIIDMSEYYSNSANLDLSYYGG